MPVIPEFENKYQEDQEINVSLGYILWLRSEIFLYDTWPPRKKKRRKETLNSQKCTVGLPSSVVDNDYQIERIQRR